VACCGACGAAVGERPESCWWCGGALCGACWEAKGHCGHGGADAVNEQSRHLSWEGRAALIRAATEGRN